MTDKEFSLRLAKLRTQKGVSARDMSLSMGQNPGYINCKTSMSGWWRARYPVRASRRRKKS